MRGLQDLIVQAQNNNQDAMMTLIQTFEPKLQGTIKNFSYANKADKEDMRQELMLEILEGVRRFSSDNVPGFWDFIEEIENWEAS